MTYSKILPATFALLLMQGFVSRPTVHAQAISLNFGNRGSHFAAAGLLPGETAGAFPVANWNDYTLPGFAQTTPSAAAGTVKDSSGTIVPNFSFGITGSLVVYDTYNYAADPQAPEQTGNLKMMGSFLKGPYEPLIGMDVTFTAVPYEEYDLYIYVDGFGTGVTLFDLVDTGEEYYSVDSSPANFLVAGKVYSEFTTTSAAAANAELASNPAGNHNYIKIPGLTTPNLTLAVLRPGGGEEAINGIQIVNAAGLDGDFDLNNRVDGNDFLVWQRDIATPGDLTVWKDNFGSPPASAAATAVPEPAAGVLAVATLLSVAGCRRFRSR